MATSKSTEKSRIWDALRKAFQRPYRSSEHMELRGHRDHNVTDGDGAGETPFKPSRSYATRKTIAQGALDFALLMANASQLKALLDIPHNRRGDYYHSLIVLIAVSVILQVVTGIVLVILAVSNPMRPHGHKRNEDLNTTSVVLILLITIVNIFISALGISYPDKPNP